MNCLKCGQEIPEGQVFCDPCLAVMKQYPVKPGTPVHILSRRERVGERRIVRETTQEALQQQMKKTIRWLWLTVAVLTATVGILSAILFQTLEGAEPQPARSSIGRNYTTSTNETD